MTVPVASQPQTGAPFEPTALSPFPEAVVEYSRRYGLEEYLNFAVELAREAFRPLAIRLEVEQDYESDDTWICLTVDVRGTVEEVLAMNRAYTKRWVERVPWPEVFRFVCSFNIS